MNNFPRFTEHDPYASDIYAAHERELERAEREQEIAHDDERRVITDNSMKTEPTPTPAELRTAELAELDRLIPALKLQKARLEKPFRDAQAAWLRAIDRRDLLQAEQAVADLDKKP